MSAPPPPPAGRPPTGWQPAGPYVSPSGQVGRANPDETVQLRFAPGAPPGWPFAPDEPVPAAPPRPWWAFLPTLVWLAAAAFTVGALIALS